MQTGLLILIYEKEVEQNVFYVTLSIRNKDNSSSVKSRGQVHDTIYFPRAFNETFNYKIITEFE